MNNVEKILSSKQLNKQVRNDMTNVFDVDAIAKAVTHFAFRNGPIEDIHANPEKDLTDEDMKILNKFAHNRLAYVFDLIFRDRWAEFALLVETHKYFGTCWDKAEPDDGEMKELMQLHFDTVASKRSN